MPTPVFLEAYVIQFFFSPVFIIIIMWVSLSFGSFEFTDSVLLVCAENKTKNKSSSSSITGSEREEPPTVFFFFQSQPKLDILRGCVYTPPQLINYQAPLPQP